VEERRVRTDQRWDAGVGVGGGKPGINALVCRSLDVDHHVDVEPVERGQHSNNEENSRDGRSGEVSRRRSSSGSLAAGKPGTERLNNFRTPAVYVDPAIATMRYSTATHYRQAHLILESASPGQRGGSHSKQGCSIYARTLDGGYGRRLISIHVSGYKDKKKPWRWPGKLTSAAA
jgi:hypothetical protein